MYFLYRFSGTIRVLSELWVHEIKNIMPIFAALCICLKNRLWLHIIIIKIKVNFKKYSYILRIC